MHPEEFDLTDLNTHEENTGKACALLKLLSHPVRLSILCNLMHFDELSAGEIVRAEEHRASQSQVSQYLAKLRQDEIVSTRREGQTIYYRVTDPGVQAIVQALHKIFCDKPPKRVSEITSERTH